MEEIKIGNFNIVFEKDRHDLWTVTVHALKQSKKVPLLFEFKLLSLVKKDILKFKQIESFDYFFYVIAGCVRTHMQRRV